MIIVSWYDSWAFARWIGGRLPTEAEWEYACRAGTGSAWWCCGNDESKLDGFAWYDANAGGKAHPVGSKKPNAWGLYDMHGNVWEWCQDWFEVGYYASSTRVHPREPEEGPSRVFRGGSWYDRAQNTRSACRDRGDPHISHQVVGFRVAADPPRMQSKTSQQAKSGA